jgi:hypothetical protein
MGHLPKFALFLVTLFGSSNAAAILLSLLKELQKESENIGHLTSISQQWCDDALHQTRNMDQVIQGQLDDATIAVQQIQSDEKRLQSELTLAQSTQQQREQQLQDALATSKFAAAEFESEKDQLNKTLEASQHAVKLLKTEMQVDRQDEERKDEEDQLGGSDGAVASFLQISGDHITDDDKNLLQNYITDPQAIAAARPQEMLAALTKLKSKLEKEQSQTFAEQQVMSLRLWSFTDHLNSSIMESKSQSASISMEMSQRKREQTRLNGKIGTLTALLRKVEASKKAMSDLCDDDKQHKMQIEKYIAEESEVVHSTLKQMPALSSELLFDLSSVLPAPATFDFLQRASKQKVHTHSKMHDSVNPILKDLQAMAKQFPEDSTQFTKAAHDLRVGRSFQAAKAAPVDQQPVDGIKGFARSSIQDIYAYLKSDDGQGGGVSLPGEERMLLENSGDLHKVTDVYQKLLDHVHTEEKSVDDQLKWCGSIARDAKVDSDAVARSLKWTGAKLNLVRVAMSEYESTIQFNTLQQKAIAARQSQLQKLVQVEDSQLQQSHNSLKDYVEQLTSLVSELIGKVNADERKGADVVRALMEMLEKHQGLLQQWGVQNKDRREAVDSALKVVQSALADGKKQSERRLVKLQVESQVLASLASSKAKDKELSEKYVQISQSLCSSDRAKKLQASGVGLRQEASAVQRSLTALSQPLE